MRNFRETRSGLQVFLWSTSAGLAAILASSALGHQQDGPQIRVVSPQDGIDTAPSSTVTITAEVRDSDGVASVELFWGKLNTYWPCEDVAERRCTRQGDRYTWQVELGSQTGNRQYHFRARDRAGAQTVSAARTLRATSQPTGVALSLVAPENGANVDRGAPVNFEVRAEGANVSAVRIRMAGEPLTYDLRRDRSSDVWRLPARVATDALAGVQTFLLEAVSGTGAVATAGPYDLRIAGGGGGPVPEGGNFPVFRWRSLTAPNDQRVDLALQYFNAVASADNDGGGYDFPCPLTPPVTRQGPVQLFTFGDGSLDTQAELLQVVSRPRGAYVVNEINYCGGPPKPGSRILGCATVGSHGAIAVVNRATAAGEGRLWLHEFGHTKGLRHRDSSLSSNIMQSGHYITEAQCRKLQVVQAFPLIGGEQVPTGGGGENISQFIRREFFEGIDWDEADHFTAAEIPYLLRQLANPQSGVSLPTVVGVIGIIGDVRGVQPLISFVERGRGALTRDQYEARKAALLSLGLIAARTNDAAALDYLSRGLSTAHWDARLSWSLPYSGSDSLRDWQMVKMAVWGLAYSGQPRAGSSLQALRTRLASAADIVAAPEDLSELLAEAEVTHRTVAAIGVESFFRRQN